MKTDELRKAAIKSNDSRKGRNKFFVTKELADFTQLYWLGIPALKLKKLFVDRFRPYKHGEQVRRDLFKLLPRGIGNLLSGALSAPFALFGFLIVNPIYAAATRQFTNKHFWRLAIITAAKPFMRIALGTAQLATWALNPIFAPIRALITLIKGKPKLEDNRGFRKLAGPKFDKAVRDQNIDRQRDILDLLYSKSVKNIQRGQKTGKSFPVQTVKDAVTAVQNANEQTAKINTEIQVEQAMGIEVTEEEINQRMEPVRQLLNPYYGNPAERITLFRNAMSARDHERSLAKDKTAHAPRTANGQRH